MIETKKVIELLQPYSDAGYPAVAVETCEERRLLDEMVSQPWKVFTIAAAGGLRELTWHSEKGCQEKVVDGAATFGKAFQFIAQQSESFLVVMDYQHMINSPQAYRPLLQVLPRCKAMGNMVVLVAPSWNLPAELKHDLPVINLPLPSEEELRRPLELVRSSIQGLQNGNSSEIVGAARGLTLAEAENVFALASLDGERTKRDLVEREKMRLVRSGCMSVERPSDPTLLGGLGRLKQYVLEEVVPVKDDPQLRVRGIMLVGVPGTGKSLSAKVIAAILGWPLVRFDLAAAKGSLQGQAEANLRQALDTADAVAPCVLWWDEIEKSTAGHASSAQTDGGTLLGMIGKVLTWMQEHTSPVVVVATCNDFQKLPAELTRAGRFDERFFLDLPTPSERADITMIHLQRLGCRWPSTLNMPEIISNMTDSWTGAEIEQLIKSAARRTKRDLSDRVLLDCAREIIPISKTASIQQLREWAKDHLRPANDEIEAPRTGRRVKSNVN